LWWLALAITLEACHAREVIELAFVRWGTPDIVNTDQGSQFTATEFTDVVLAQGCQLSMDGRGAWRDNVFVERLWRSVKYERVYLRAYDSVSAARSDRYAVSEHALHLDKRDVTFDRDNQAESFACQHLLDRDERGIRALAHLLRNRPVSRLAAV
jgi:transposase InsO family protein